MKTCSLRNMMFIAVMAMLLSVRTLSGELAISHNRFIEWKKSGELIGLPDEFEPATLILKGTESSETTNVTLRLGDKRVEFPPCLSILFSKAQRSEIRVSTSGYDDPLLQPYFLAIQLPTGKIGANGFYDGWSILVELWTANVSEVAARFEDDDGHSQRHQKVDLETFCTEEALEQLAPRRIDSGKG